MIYREDYDNAQDYVDAIIRRRRLKHRLIIAAIVLCLLTVLGFWLTYYRIRSIQVTGNTRYTNDEITEMVTGGFLSDNSVVLSFKYRNRQITNVPFIEQMDVTILTHDAIKITVYEKSLAGYVSYLGTNFYFGRDGTVVESSREIASGVPQILGLSFDHIALYEQLPVEDPAIFGRILNVTQLLSKYDLTADSIYFDGSGNMTIYFGEVKVAMGGDDYTDEKLSNVAQILPRLDGRGAGTLKMSGYTPSTRFITYVLRDGKAADVLADPASGADAQTADSDGSTVNNAAPADGAATGAAGSVSGAETAGTAAQQPATPSAQAAAVAGSASGTGGGWESIPETPDPPAEDPPVTETPDDDQTVNDTQGADMAQQEPVDVGDAVTSDESGEVVIPEEAEEITDGE